LINLPDQSNLFYKDEQRTSLTQINQPLFTSLFLMKTLRKIGNYWE